MSEIDLRWRGRGKFYGRDVELEVKPVTSENLRHATYVAGASFAGELKMVAASLAVSLLANYTGIKELEPFEPGSINYGVLSVEDKPAALTGIYRLKIEPNVAWMGWAGITPLARETGLFEALIESFEQAAKAEGCDTVRAWSVDNASRFKDLNESLLKAGYTAEIFEGDTHGAGKYVVFSKRFDGQPPEPCPKEAIMAGGTNEPIHDTEDVLRVFRIFADIACQNKETAEKSSAFRAKNGSTKDFVKETISDGQSRLVDLTDLILSRNRTHAWVTSLHDLNERLFPIEGERETVEGLEQYVQPSRLEDYKDIHNERRIIGILNEDGTKIIGAAIYGVASTPAELSAATNVDGVVGVTYVMTDNDYRRIGLGASLVEAIENKAKDFLRSKGINNPQIIMGAEINDINKLSLGDAIADLEGTKVAPGGRQGFWNVQDFHPLEWDDYSQVSLRDMLMAFSALRYHITTKTPDEPMSSKLVWFLIKMHADLCLNKQRGYSDADAEIMTRMRDGLLQKETVGFAERADHWLNDTKMMAAILQAEQEGLSPDTPMPKVMDWYENTVKAGIEMVEDIVSVSKRNVLEQQNQIRDPRLG